MPDESKKEKKTHVIRVWMSIIDRLKSIIPSIKFFKNIPANIEIKGFSDADVMNLDKRSLY